LVKPTYRQRAAAGAALLDEKYGQGWARKIKLRRLNQASGGFDPNDDTQCGCIAAQLDASRTGNYGSYSIEMGRLLSSEDRWNERAIARLGFNAYMNEVDRKGELTEAWKDEVRSRL